MSQWKVGDTVQLKSGGPVMTVTGVRSDLGTVLCSWFLNSDAKQHSFPYDALERAAE